MPEDQAPECSSNAPVLRVVVERPRTEEIEDWLAKQFREGVIEEAKDVDASLMTYEEWSEMYLVA